MKELEEGIEKKSYFESHPSVSDQEEDNGTRELGELYPFLICGGRNTERYYFKHVNDKTKYKFNIRPKYFGDESNYTDIFPKRIKEILDTNNEVKIFCIFDWDTIFANETKLRKHKTFESQFSREIADGIVSVCPSMPSIEYWFLLHFIDETKFMKDYRTVSNVLGRYIKDCFGDPKIPLKKLLKKETYLQDATWVENLCADGKLSLAIERAEKNIKTAVALGDLERRSYSFVYKVFMRNQ